MSDNIKGFDKEAYDKKYHKEHYYRMSIVMPKDFRAVIDEAARVAGMSKNKFILEAIREKIERG